MSFDTIVGRGAAEPLRGTGWSRGGRAPLAIYTSGHSWINFGCLAVSLASALALAPVPTTGQVLPGARPPERGTIRAEFLDAVLKGVRLTSSAWVDAWASRDVEPMSKLYVEEALLVTPEGDALHGRGDISAYLGDLLQRTTGIETFLSDLDASNNMAMTVERYVLTSAVAAASRERGLLFTVYLNDGSSWKIRTQVFRPAPDRLGRGGEARLHPTLGRALLWKHGTRDPRRRWIGAPSRIAIAAPDW